MINSIAASTLKQYESALKAWWNYVHINGLDLFNSKSPDIVSFLNKKFRSGIGHGTINTFRSAISLISIHDIHGDGLISRFLKGVFREKPSKPRYSTTWDVTPVLNYLEKLHPLSNLKLKEVSEKVACLLALATAQRLQTLSVINIDNITADSNNLSIKITEHIKTSKPGSYQPDLILPFFKDRPGLCVASAVLEYMRITKELRDTETKTLFIISVKPYSQASSQTIGHWVKSVLSKAGVNTEQFTAYSTRHAAVSIAHTRGIDIATIRRSAGWAPGSKTFFKFYNRPIQSPNDQFARAVFQ